MKQSYIFVVKVTIICIVLLTMQNVSKQLYEFFFRVLRHTVIFITAPYGPRYARRGTAIWRKAHASNVCVRVRVKWNILCKAAHTLTYTLKKDLKSLILNSPWYPIKHYILLRHRIKRHYDGFKTSLNVCLSIFLKQWLSLQQPWAE